MDCLLDLPSQRPHADPVLPYGKGSSHPPRRPADTAVYTPMSFAVGVARCPGPPSLLLAGSNEKCSKFTIYRLLHYNLGSRTSPLLHTFDSTVLQTLNYPVLPQHFSSPPPDCCYCSFPHLVELPPSRCVCHRCLVLVVPKVPWVHLLDASSLQAV